MNRGWKDGNHKEVEETKFAFVQRVKAFYNQRKGNY